MSDCLEVCSDDHEIMRSPDSDPPETSRRKFLTRATLATAAVGLLFAAVPFIESWLPSERARALGGPLKVECLPKARFRPGEALLGADWPGGFFCLCHGSRFDLAGRVFDGSPASVNLVIPAYALADEHTLVIGEDRT